MLVYLNVLIYILFNFQRPFSFTTFVVTICFLLSPSSNSLSVSLGLNLVNNCFSNLLNSFFKRFYQILSSCLRFLETSLILTSLFGVIIFISSIFVYLVLFFVIILHLSTSYICWHTRSSCHINFLINSFYQLLLF